MEPLAIDPPPTGRIYEHRRRVQLADGSPKGRLRLDAVARYLQDVSDEDTTDAGFPPEEPWVVRRVEAHVAEFPGFRDTVTVTTWCSGIGSRWAERRVRIVGDAGGRIDAAVLWVHLDAQGRPARLSERFHDTYAEAARDRTIRARLQHESTPPDAAVRTPFPLRVADVDVMQHVNNAVSWVPVEEALVARRSLRAPLHVSVEHPAPVDVGTSPEVAVADVDGGFDVWLLVDGRACATGQVRSAQAGSPTGA